MTLIDAARSLSVPDVAAARAPVTAPEFRLVQGSFGPAEPDLAAAWDRLAAGAAEPNVFAERWFVEASTAHLPDSAGARLLQLWRGGRLIALLPLRIDARYGRIPLRHVTNWRHHHSFLGAPLIAAGSEAEAWRALLDAIDRAPWAGGILHIEGIVEGGPIHQGLQAASRALGRPCDTVHRIERAMLASELSPETYYERTLRKKKRKEIRRLRSRLDELGSVAARKLAAGDDPLTWAEEFLALEASGWKGRAGSALACRNDTAAFFRAAIAGAHAAARLEMLRLDLDGRAIAMLVNFLAPPGSFSFKIAFDEDYARFSPGVLIQLENLAILGRRDIAWMDSCAVENHPMINSLWAERRPIVRVTLPIAGTANAIRFHACRTIERIAAQRRKRRNTAQPAEIEDDDG